MRYARFILATIALMAFTACSSDDSVQKAAETAIARLDTYAAEVQRKLDAEEKYYTDIRKQISKQGARLRESKQPAWFRKKAGRFATANAGKDAKAIAEVLPDTVKTFRDGWAGIDEEFDTLRHELIDALEKNHQAIMLEHDKIAKARAKLATLRKARDTKAMLELLVAVARESKAAIDAVTTESK